MHAFDRCLCSEKPLGEAIMMNHTQVALNAHIELPADSTPPRFADLRVMLERVLSGDPGGAPNMADLTPQ